MAEENVINLRVNALVEGARKAMESLNKEVNNFVRQSGLNKQALNDETKAYQNYEKAIKNVTTAEVKLSTANENRLKRIKESNKALQDAIDREEAHAAAIRAKEKEWSNALDDRARLQNRVAEEEERLAEMRANYAEDQDKAIQRLKAEQRAAANEELAQNRDLLSAIARDRAERNDVERDWINNLNKWKDEQERLELEANRASSDANKEAVAEINRQNAERERLMALHTEAMESEYGKRRNIEFQALRNQQDSDPNIQAIKDRVANRDFDRGDTDFDNSYRRNLNKARIATRGIRGEVEKVTSAFRRGTKAAGDNNTMMSKLALTNDENSKSARRLEMRLARLGRAMLGLAIASVLIFLNSFSSALVAVGGQAIALAGSIGYAATAIGGTLVSAIAQAIPMLGVLGAAFGRVSAIQDAMGQADLVEKQNFGPEAETADADAAQDAADRIADARDNQREAEEDLTEARRDARLELEDLILAEREAELAMRGAMLTQEEAREQLRASMQSGDIGAIDRDQLGVDEARFGVRTARVDLDRARNAAREARAGGINNMPGVIDATKALADANKDLADSHDEAAKSAIEQSAAESSLDYYLSQLTDSERRLYNAMMNFRDRFKKEFAPITDTIIDSFTFGITAAEDLIFDNKILAGFQRLANGMSNSMDRLSAVFTSDASKDFWGEQLREGRRNLAPMTDIVENLYNLFMNIAEGAAPVLHKMLNLIADETERWVDGTSDKGQVTEFFSTGLRHARAWYGVLTGVIELFGELMNVSGGSALDTLDAFTNKLEDASDYLRSNATDSRGFFNESAVALGYLGDVVVELGRMLVETFDANAVKSFRDLLVNVVIPAFGMLIEFTGKVAIALDNMFSGWVGDAASFILAAKLISGSLGLLFNLLVAMVSPLGRIITFFYGLVSAMRAAGIGALTLSGVIKAALITTGIGALIVGLGLVIDKLGIFSSSQEKAKTTTEQVTSALQAQKSALQALQDFGSNQRNAELAAESARLNEISARRAMRQAREDYGKDSLQYLQAEVAYKQAVQNTADAETAAKRAARGRNEEIRTTRVESAKAVEDSGNRVSELESERAAIKESINDIREMRGNAERGGEVWNEYAKQIAEKEGQLRVNTDELTQARKDHTKALRVDARVNEAAADITVEATGSSIEYKNAVQFATENVRNFTDKLTKSIVGNREFKDTTDKSTSALKDEDKGLGNVSDALGIVKDNLNKTRDASGDMAGKIVDVTNKVLKEFGADPIAFSLGIGTDSSDPKKKTPGKGGQSGGFFGNPSERGPDDRLVRVAGGEAILTGHQQQAVNMALAYGNQVGAVPYASLNDLFAKDSRPHATAPAFAKGGIVPVPSSIPQYDANMINSAILPTVQKFVERFNLTLNDAYGPGHASIEHTQLGTAVDFGPGPGASWDNVGQAVAAAVKSGYTPVYYDGSFGSIDLPPHGPGHHAHITFLTAEEYGSGSAPGALGAAGFNMAENIDAAIKKIGIKGGEGTALRAMLDAQSKKLHGAAQDKVDKVAGAVGGVGASMAGITAGSNAALGKKMIQAFGWGEDWARFNELVMRESGWDENIWNLGGSGAYGIAQALPASKYPEAGQPSAPPGIQKAKAQIGWMLNYIKERYGNLSSALAFHDANNWYQHGGEVPEFDKGGVVPGQRGSVQYIKAHGGETVLPTHKFQSGGIVDSVKSAFQNIGEIMGGSFTGWYAGDKPVFLENIAEDLEELLGEGGALDLLSEQIELRIQRLSDELNDWAYRIRRGTVAMIRTHKAMAREMLDNLEKTYDALRKQQEIVNDLMKETAKAIRQSDDDAERQKLRTAMQNLKMRRDELATAINNSLIEQVEAQNAIFDAAMARFDQRLGLTESRRRILELRAEKRGKENPNEAALVKNLKQSGNILEAERRAIRKELKEARRSGDIERQREMRQALIDNKIALLENTVAIKDAKGTLNKIFSFNSTPWQMYRQAIHNGAGEFFPPMPSAAVGATVVRSGAVNVHAGEIIAPPDKIGGDTHLYFTEPIENADPEAISSSVAWKLKTMKTY